MQFIFPQILVPKKNDGQILKHHLFFYCNYYHLTKEGSHTLTLQSVSDLMSSVLDILTSQNNEVSALDTQKLETNSETNKSGWRINWESLDCTQRSKENPECIQYYREEVPQQGHFWVAGWLQNSPHPLSLSFRSSEAHASANTASNALLWFTQTVKLSAPRDSGPGTNQEVGPFLCIPYPDKKDTPLSWNPWLLHHSGHPGSYWQPRNHPWAALGAKLLTGNRRYLYCPLCSLS